MSSEIPYAALKPSDITDAQWREIIDTWENGLSDREAAFRASKATGRVITEARIKQLVAESEEIGMIRDACHSEILSRAKLNVKDSIMSGNISTSKWYLERKAPEEFSTKAAVAFEGGVATSISMAEKQEEMDAFMEQFGKKEKSLEVGKFPKGTTDTEGKPIEEEDEQGT